MVVVEIKYQRSQARGIGLALQEEATASPLSGCSVAEAASTAIVVVVIIIIITSVVVIIIITVAAATFLEPRLKRRRWG